MEVLAKTPQLFYKKCTCSSLLFGGGIDGVYMTAAASTNDI